jgi:hypothetical protein
MTPAKNVLALIFSVAGVGLFAGCSDHDHHSHRDRDRDEWRAQRAGYRIDNDRWNRDARYDRDGRWDHDGRWDRDGWHRDRDGWHHD